MKNEKFYKLMLASILITTVLSTTIAVAVSPGTLQKNQLKIACWDVWQGGHWEWVNISANGRPVGNATVVFNDGKYLTDAYGTAWIYVPPVNQSMVGVILAYKQGYLPDQKMIVIVP
jgi:hypothetical protein